MSAGFAPPYVEVQTEALGLSANEVEDLVTLNVEELLAGVPWLETMRSKSIPGYSSVIMIFEPGTNLMQARQMVQERLTGSYALPNASKPPQMIQPLSATSRVATTYGVRRSRHRCPAMRWMIAAPAGAPAWPTWRCKTGPLQADRSRASGRAGRDPQVIASAGNAPGSRRPTRGVVPRHRGRDRRPQPAARDPARRRSTPQDLARVTVEALSLRLGDVATW
jgi:hypothetical protein